MTGTIELAGRRVLLVEDEALIALDMEEVLRAGGLLVTGPIATIEAALEIADRVEPDIALLDVNLARHPVWPVAEVLNRRGIPIAFLTGYAGLEFPAEFAQLPRLQKPINPQALLDQLRRLLANGRAPHSKWSR